MPANSDQARELQIFSFNDREVKLFSFRTSSLMVSPSANPQTLDGLGVTYEELLFYGQQHIIGKRVRYFTILNVLGILNPHGSFCLEQSQCSSMVRHYALPFNPLLFRKDYIVTFEEELNFVWRVPPRFSLAKLLFIVVGHVTLEC